MLPGVYISSETLGPSRYYSRPGEGSSRAYAPENCSDLSPFLSLLAFILHDKYGGDKQNKYYHTPGALLDTSFTGQRPIIGEGHHFTVFGSPFEKWENVPAHVKRYNPEAYCIKFPNPGFRNDDGFLKEVNETVLREMKVLCHPNLESHENIIGFLGLDFHEDYDDHNIGWPCPLMEVAEFGTLDSFQYDQGRLNESLTTNLLLDIASGLDALHKCNIIHGDVKSENVLICRHNHRKYVAKLSDFGLSIINPDPEALHRLIGGTWLWEAPEIETRMSVQGLKQTDLFSLGLLIWRVLINRSMPYETLGQDIVNRYQSPDQTSFVYSVKQDPEFCGIVLHSLRYSGSDEWAKSFGIAILPYSLGHDPNSRYLQKILAEMQNPRRGVPQRGLLPPEIIDFPANVYWASYDLENILEQMIDAYPECIGYFKTRPFVLYQLLANLDPATRSNSTSARLATLLSFTLVTSGEVFGEKHDEALTRKLLLRLSELEYFSFAAILPLYHEITATAVPTVFNPKTLEAAAKEDFYMAKWALARYYPDQYHTWLSQTIRQTEIAFQGRPDFNQHMLLGHLRQGNFEECKRFLNMGVEPPDELDELGPVHWLTSFGNGPQIDELLHLLLQAGCIIDGWVDTGRAFDLLAGRIDGTPLHCAVITRNLHLVRALCRLDIRPNAANIDTAFKIAASLHFADVLHILNEWVNGLNHTGQSCHQLNQWNLLVFAVLPHTPHLQMARLLRHGKRGATDAMLATLDFLSNMGTLSFEQQKNLIQFLILHGCGKGFSLLTAKFKMRESPGQWTEYLKGILSQVILFGDIDAFSAVLDSGLIPKDICFINDKYTLMQTCCISASRRVEFIQKALQLGCSLDALGPGDEYQPSAFVAAVAKGSYDTASYMLQNGADKDFKSGWLGGQTCIARLLQQPDLPISRLRYMLEALPEEGFGHVDYIVGPSLKQNIFHAIASSPWASHRSSYRQAEIMKYLLSVIGDHSCINQTDIFGYTPLYFAASKAQLELCEILIEAGADVQASVCRSPLNGLIEWLETCARREKDSWSTTKVGEKKLAAKLLDNARKTVELLTSKGATDWKANPFRIQTAMASGQIALPNLATTAELLSAFFTHHGQDEYLNAGNRTFLPTRSKDFVVHRGNRNLIQNLFTNVARRVESMTGTGNAGSSRDTRRQQLQLYAPHSCWPWVPCHFYGQPAASGVIVTSVRSSLNSRNSAARERLVSSLPSVSASYNHGPHIIPGVVTRQRGMSVSRLGTSLSSLTLGTPTSPSSPSYPKASSSKPGPTVQPTLLSHKGVSTVKMQLSNHLEHLVKGPQGVVDRTALKLVLEEVFESPILLNESCRSIQECIEFAELSSIIESWVGELSQFNLSLVTILEAGDLQIFVFE